MNIQNGREKRDNVAGIGCRFIYIITPPLQRYSMGNSEGKKRLESSRPGGGGERELNAELREILQPADSYIIYKIISENFWPPLKG